MTLPPPARYRVGNVDIAVLTDGTFEADAGVVMGVVPRILWEPAIGTPDANNRISAGINCLLIRSRGKTFLVDTGFGDKLSEAQRKSIFPGDYGHLPESLEACGVAPAEIDVVVNSHLHADHSGWNTIRRGEDVVPYFGNARYCIHRSEIEDARRPNERTRATYFAENFEPLVAADRLDPVAGETRLTDEVTLIETPGHTAGHLGVAISSGGETALYLGDMLQHEVQLARLPWIAAFDVMPLVSLETKRSIVERALRDNSILFCGHLAFPGAGRMVTTNGGRPQFEALAPGGDA